MCQWQNSTHMSCKQHNMTQKDTKKLSHVAFFKNFIVILGSFQKIIKKKFQKISRIACEEIFDVGVKAQIFYFLLNEIKNCTYKNLLNTCIKKNMKLVVYKCPLLPTGCPGIWYLGTGKTGNARWEKWWHGPKRALQKIS